jgi:putative endonuclease
VISLLYRVADRLRHHARRKSLPVAAVNGKLGEDLAHRFLRRRGYTVIARNYRPPSGGGEIDLIAMDAGKLVFVEVKTRSGAEFGSPEDAVDSEKRAFIERAARDYARRREVEWEQVRFDLVSVVLGHSPYSVELRKDAFHPRRTL